MPDPRKLHRAAIAVYSAEALGSAALPIAILVGMSLLGGGGLDLSALLRVAIYGAVGVAFSVVMGYLKWDTTRYWITETGISLHTGIVKTQDTNVPFERIQAIDVHQGVLQRRFGVFAVDVQTGAGGKGGEISLPALLPSAVEDLRAARPSAVAAVLEEASGPVRRLSVRSLLLAAVTAGQLGVILPVLAVFGQTAQQVFDPEQGEEAVRLIPHSSEAIVLAALALLGAAWLLSTLGSLVAFAGFTVGRVEDRLRIRRGLFQRREATVPVGRVRAVRVVEGVLRRPFGLASLTVEVTGYAEEASAARTLYPLLRVDEVRAFLDELLPEFADELTFERPPARAARRYFAPPLLAGAIVSVAAFFAVGAWSVPALVLGVLYGWARWRAAGWHFSDGRLAVRGLRVARVTVLAPARFRESHTLVQNVFQRRAGLADLDVAFGKRTTARIRHLDASVVRETWAALSTNGAAR